MKAALGLGSNVGNRRQHLLWGWRRLEDVVKVRAFSRMVETVPVGPRAGVRPYLNAAVVVETDGSPRELLELTREIEDLLGRDPDDRGGPRPLDIDLLLCDELEVEEPELVIPHPQLAERLFVLEPLAEVAGDWIVPGKYCTVEVLLEDLRKGVIGRHDDEDGRRQHAAPYQF